MSLCDCAFSLPVAHLCGQNHEIIWKLCSNWAGAADLDSRADAALRFPPARPGGCGCAPVLGAPVTFISDILLGV